MIFCNGWFKLHKWTKWTKYGTATERGNHGSLLGQEEVYKRICERCGTTDVSKKRIL